MAVLLAVVLIIGLPQSLFAWPTEGEWIPIYREGVPLGDPQGDAQGSRDIVGDSDNPAAYLFNNGEYMYFRLRLDGDPSQGAGLRPFGWGFLIDTDQDASDYEWMIMIDGIDSTIHLDQNTYQQIIGDPSDKAEILAWADGIAGYFQVQPASSSFGGNPDYFLDFRIPYDTFLVLTGLNESSVIRYFFGTSNSTQSLSADLAATDLYGGFSDFVLPIGTLPTTGSVRFVQDLAGSGDVTQIYTGGTLFIRVDDPDQNSSSASLQTVTVTLTALSGDTETVTLTETGFDTGIFTGSIVTSDDAIVAGDGVLQVVPIETVTVTYTDAADGSDPPLQNQIRTDSVLVFAGADLEITKAVNDSTPDAGDPIIYTITITNNGSLNATNVVVTDNIPAGLTIGTVVPSQGTWTAPSWNVGTIANGATATLEIAATVTAASGTLTNTAWISAADQGDPMPDNNSASIDITVGGTDLAVTKTVDDSTPDPAGLIIYTITVTNNGPKDATGVVVTDNLPAGLTVGTVTPSQGTWVAPSWDVGTVNNGASATLIINATVDAGVGSVLTNTAQITDSDPADPISGNNSASVDITVPGADLRITKIVDVPFPIEGTPINYTIEVLNNGPSDTTDVEVTDALPAGVTYVSDIASQGNYDSGSGLWTIGPLADGVSATLNITATVDAGTTGDTISNTAQISSSSLPDPVPGNNSASVDIIVPEIDLAVTKAVDNLTPDSGAIVTFTVTIKNNGPYDATNVEVTDVLPAGLSYVSDTPSFGNYNSAQGVWTLVEAGNRTLLSGVIETLTITATVDAAVGSLITNTARLTASDQTDVNPANDLQNVTLYVGGTDLAITKTADNPTPTEGDTVTYTITVINNGPNPATNVIITDAVPAGLTYVTASIGGGDGNDDSDPTGGGLTWTVNTLASGTSTDLTFEVTVDAGTGGLPIVNTARITAADQTDPLPGNDTATAIITVQSADLAVVKTVDNPLPIEGTNVIYAITVTNNGPYPATGIILTDLLPAEVVYISDDSGGSYDSVTGEWSVGGLAKSAAATLNLTARVNPGTAGTTITNTAAVTASDQTDPVPANDTASADITPSSGPDILVLKTVYTLSDPINGGTNPKAIPGAEMMYTITVINTGGGAVDADTVVITDSVPANTVFFADVPGGGSSVVFIDGTTASGLTFSPDDIGFSDNGGITYTYVPDPDANGFDLNVTDIRINPKGAMLGSDGVNNPSFSLLFKVRVQ